MGSLFLANFGERLLVKEYATVILFPKGTTIKFCKGIIGVVGSVRHDIEHVVTTYHLESIHVKNCETDDEIIANLEIEGWTEKTLDEVL